MYRFMKIFSAFICLLPKGLQYAIGTLLGEIAWLAVPPKRKRLAIGQILFCNITDDPKLSLIHIYVYKRQVLMVILP